MANVRTTERVRVVDVLEKLGSCVELVPLDPHFQDISVGLYMKNGTGTVWTFSRKPGAEDRIEVIRDQLGALGGMEPVPGTRDQTRFSCGQVHDRPLKFLVKQAVEKAPDYALPEGRTKDLRSALMLGIESSEADGKWVYRVTAEGDAPNEAQRLRAVSAGFTRYGEMEKSDDDELSFACGHRHDRLAKLVLPYARNVSQAEDMLASEALRGQMTTGTLGFTPPT